MAVSSVGNAYEFTADGDLLAERVDVESFLATGGSTGGKIDVYGNAITIAANGTITPSPSTEKLIWSSGTLNANAEQESAISVGWQNGIRVVGVPSGGKLVMFVN